jgi:hypothetical protein
MPRRTNRPEPILEITIIPSVFMKNLSGIISLVHRLPCKVTDQRLRTKKKKSGFSPFLMKLVHELACSL